MLLKKIFAVSSNIQIQKTYLVGAGLAEPEAVLRVMGVAPFVLEIELVEVTLNLEGLGVDVAEMDGVLLCGMRDGVVSSIKK